MEATPPFTSARRGPRLYMKTTSAVSMVLSCLVGRASSLQMSRVWAVGSRAAASSAPRRALSLASSSTANAMAARGATAAGAKPRVRVLSGVQPTGRLTLGNYLGAIRNWVDLQGAYETFYCVVDLHAITAPHDPKQLAEETMSAAAVYLAAGVDPDQVSERLVPRGYPTSLERECFFSAGPLLFFKSKI